MRTVAPLMSVLVLAGGCATVSPRATVFDGRPALGAAPRSSALYSPALVGSPEDPDAAPEYARRDESLSPQVAYATTAVDQWGPDPRPTLLRRGHVHLFSRQFGESVIFFLPERRARWDRP